MIPRELVDALVKLRYKAHLRQEDVAYQIGCSATHVLHFENLRVDPRLSFIQAYARAVGARLDISMAHPEFGVELEIVLPEGLEPTLNRS